MKVKIELNPDGIKQLLQTDQGIHDDLQARVDNVVNAAGEGHDGEVWVGKDRQRGTVRTTTHEAKKNEAENHTLLKALDAARSP